MAALEFQRNTLALPRIRRNLHDALVPGVESGMTLAKVAKEAVLGLVKGNDAETNEADDEAASLFVSGTAAPATRSISLRDSFRLI